jgi:filamentous hemagglutinin family protein
MAGSALPQSPQTQSGTVGFTTSGNTLTINQSSNSAIINWNTFNIGAGSTVRINMPSSNSVELDRVTGGLGPSQIFGTLTSNGNVFLVNPNGILFGQGAVVNVGGLLATSDRIRNSDFIAGRYVFHRGNPAVSVVNQGSITATSGGFAALVAPGVRNSGTITATLGMVGLTAGNAFTLDMYGDKLITLAVNDNVANKVIDVATGQPLSSLVTNTGKLGANGGKVQITAAAARIVLDSVINTSGVIEANTIGTKNGMIVLSAATGASKPSGAPAQNVKIAGTISAAGKRKGTTGGTIVVEGENISVSGAKINASGHAGGGTVLIGGDVGGGNPNPAVASIPQAKLESFVVPTATIVSVDAATTINASAIATGNGGKVVVWSDQLTTFMGLIRATGGASGGNGGFVETSGHTLNIDGASVSTAAPKGHGGHWLLDPNDFTVDSKAAASINAALAGGDVIVATSASGTGGNGDIFVNSPIAWSTNYALTLDAYRNVFVNANITTTGNNASLIIFYNDGGSGGNLLTGAGASVTLSATNPLLAINGQPYTLIRTASDLQNIGLNGFYALTNNIDLSSISNFVPIGYSPQLTILTIDHIVPSQLNFNGVLDGLGHTVSNLTINNTLAWDAGLFIKIGTSGTIRNLSMINANVVGGASPFATPFNSDPAGFGVLAGVNFGSVNNVSVAGSITAPNQVGGLIGYNDGTVTNSFANVAMSGSIAGGLVGFNYGTIGDSAASGQILGVNNAAGGLVGQNGGTIHDSYATGSVSLIPPVPAQNDFYQGGVGGLIGINSGIVTNTYASGSVYGGDAKYYVGGLIGTNCPICLITNGPPPTGLATVTASYATGAVSSGNDSATQTAQIGGLVGGNNGAITSSFATGSVTPGIGYQSSALVNNLSAPNGTFFAAASIGAVTATWDFVNTWYMGSAGLPLLQAFRPVASSAPPAATPNPGTQPRPPSQLLQSLNNPMASIFGSNGTGSGATPTGGSTTGYPNSNSLPSKDSYPAVLTAFGVDPGQVSVVVDLSPLPDKYKKLFQFGVTATDLNQKTNVDNFINAMKSDPGATLLTASSKLAVGKLGGDYVESIIKLQAMISPSGSRDKKAIDFVENAIPFMLETDFKMLETAISSWLHGN